MKETTIFQLDDTDLVMVELLRSLGIQRWTARALIYLSGAGSARQKEIERGAGLRQPEVSKAMKDLTRFKWAEQNGNEYMLILTLSKIVCQLEKTAQSRTNSIESHFQKLKALAEAACA